VDIGVILNNFQFLIVQGLIGIGNFTGGTLRLAIPAMVLGFVLGIFIGVVGLAAVSNQLTPTAEEVASELDAPTLNQKPQIYGNR